MKTRYCFNETLQLSARIVEQFYKRDLDSVLPLLHSDVIWIGAADSQYFQGYAAVSKQLKLLSDAPACQIRDVQFDLTVLDTSTCVVTGQYLAETNPDSGEVLAAVQRVTFIWTNAGGGLRLIHMHVSNPLEIQKKDETFPHQAGKRNYDYLQKLLKKQRCHGKPLALTGKNAETFFIQPEEIIYVEAVNINCILHCTAKSPFVCMPMAQISELLPSYFVRIHRSYIVNPHRITEIRRCYVILENGDRLPIPEKKYRDIKNLLKNYSHIG